MRKAIGKIAAAMLALAIISCSGNVNRNIFPYMEFGTAKASDGSTVAKVTLLKAMETLGDLPEKVVIDGVVYPLSMFGGYSDEAGKEAKKVTIPEQLTKIEDGAFDNAQGMEKVVIEAEDVDIAGAGFNDSTVVVDRNGDLYNPVKYYPIAGTDPAEVEFKITKSTGGNPYVPEEIEIGGVTYKVTTFAGYESASEAEKDTTLVLPKSVTKMTANALEYSRNLTTLVVENEEFDISTIENPSSTDGSVESIMLVQPSGDGEASVWYMRDDMESVEVPESVRIGGAEYRITTFAGYQPDTLGANVEKLVLPDTITKVADGAWDGVDSLKELYVGAGTEVDADKLPSTLEVAAEIVSKDEEGKTAAVRLIRNLDIPGTIEIDGTAYAVDEFCGYSSEEVAKTVTALTIPDSIRRISDEALAGTKLGSLVVPTGLEIKGVKLPSPDSITSEGLGTPEIYIEVTGDSAVWPEMPSAIEAEDDWELEGWYYVDSTGAEVEAKAGESAPSGAKAYPKWKISETQFGDVWLKQYNPSGIAVNISAGNESISLEIDDWQDGWAAEWKLHDSAGAEIKSATGARLEAEGLNGTYRVDMTLAHGDFVGIYSAEIVAN